MTPAELHAAVLAALEAAEGVASGRCAPLPWEVQPAERGVREMARVEAEDGGVAYEVCCDEDAAFIALAANLTHPALAMVRRVVEEHAPVFGKFVPHVWCHGCAAPDWPCATYRDAAAVVGVEVGS